MLFILIISGVVATVSVLFLVAFQKARNLKNHGLRGKHVMITGGSSGIGKACAMRIARMGASVTLLARDQAKLDATAREVQHAFEDCVKQKVVALSVDVSGDHNTVEKAVEKAINDLGPVFMLINCAGTSISHRFEDTNMEDFERMYKLNLLGSVSVTKAVLPCMKEQRNGHIIFVSSLAGLLGLYGYTAYSASKFALLGLAEGLCMEVKPFNIKVTISFPPDTDTPGFEEEQKSKPVETRMISESAGLFSPDVVAKKLVSDALLGSFSSVVGFEGLMIATLCSGFTPASSCIQLLFQICSMGIFRLIGAVFLWNCDRTIRQCARNKEQEKRLQ